MAQEHQAKNDGCKIFAKFTRQQGKLPDNEQAGETD
jgi:hypothetical protein